MILKGSNFNVIDNTGARKVQCIQYIGKKLTSNLKVGNIMVVAIKNMEKVKENIKLKVQKGDVCYAIIVKTRKPLMRKTGIQISANINGVLLLNKKKEPLGTRVNGLLYEEVSRIGLIKALALTKDFI